MTPPSFRTIQRWAQEMGQLAESKWELTDATESDIPFLLGVTRHVIRQSKGNKTSLTKDEAALAISIKWAAPDLEVPYIWALAEAYTAYNRRGDSTADLDTLLAFRPWLSRENTMEYCELLRDEVAAVPDLPDGLLGGELILCSEYARGVKVGGKAFGHGIVGFMNVRNIALVLANLPKELDYQSEATFDAAIRKSIGDWHEAVLRHPSRIRRTGHERKTPG